MKNQYNIVLLFFILAGLISCSTTHKLCESNKVKLKVKKALEQETSAYVAYLDSVKGKDSTRVVLISKYTEKGTPVVVVGHLSIDKYEGQNGTVYKTTLIADDVHDKWQLPMHLLHLGRQFRFPAVAYVPYGQPVVCRHAPRQPHISLFC